MDQRVFKLNHRLHDCELAERLIAAGLDTPRKIKAASDKQVEGVEGVGKSALETIRGRFPRQAA